jgi:hypothetical protein
VKDFGAVGDGVTDDTAAIQAAIDSMGANNGDLIITAGTYSFNSTLTISGSHHTIEAKGGAVLQWDGITGTTGLQFGDGTAGTANLNVRNLRVNDNTATGVDRLVYINNCDRSNFENVYLGALNTNTSGVLLTHGSTTGNPSIINSFYNLKLLNGWTGLEIRSNTNGVHFYNFIAEGQEKYGVLQLDSQPLYEVAFFGGTIESIQGNTSVGMYFAHPNSTINIDSVYFESNDQHIQFAHNPAVSGIKATISNCRFISGGGTGCIELGTYQYVQATNNFFLTIPLVHLNNANARWHGEGNSTTDAISEVSKTTGVSYVNAKSAKNTYNGHPIPEIEAGATGTIASGGSVTVTFTNAFVVAPIVVATHSAGTSRTGSLTISVISTTQVTIHNWDAAATVAEWVAVSSQ